MGVIASMGFPGGAVVKNLSANARGTRSHGFNSWVRKIPWSRKWQPTLVFSPGKFHGREAWWARVYEVAKSQTGLSDFPFMFHFHALEKEMAPHSSVLAWRIPGTGEPGGLPSMGSHRVGHD